MDFSTSDTRTEISIDCPERRERESDLPFQRDERNNALKVLIAAAAQGDTEAFDALYNSTASWLLARVRRIVGESHCEDVLAEVFLQVWRTLSVYAEGRGEPLAWLATIARSRSLDRIRTEKRSHGGQLDAPATPSYEESHDAGPEELLAAAECASLLKISMGQLSPKERLVLGMAYFRDCTQSEIANLTGMPLGSVKTLMTRSQHKLRLSMTAAEGISRLKHNVSFSHSPRA